MASRRQDAQSHELEDELVVHVDDTNWEEIVGPAALLSHRPSGLPVEFREIHLRVSTEFVELLVSPLTSFKMRRGASFLSLLCLLSRLPCPRYRRNPFQFRYRARAMEPFYLGRSVCFTPDPLLPNWFIGLRLLSKLYLVRGLDRTNRIHSRCDGILVRPSVVSGCSTHHSQAGA